MPDQELLLKFESISLFEYFSFLAGEGAFNWALEHGFSGCCDDDLITGKCYSFTDQANTKDGYDGGWGGGGGGYQIQVLSPNLAQNPGHSLMLAQISVTKLTN